MRVLLVHQNFPGQFRRIAQIWSQQPGWEVIGLGHNKAPGLPGVRWIPYDMARPPMAEQHAYLRQMEDAVLRGQATARVMLKLRKQGWKPDAILAHPGWGETLYAKDIFPDAKLIHFCEWYYGTPGSDMDFDPEFPTHFDALAKLRTWNALHSLNLAHCDIGVSPTAWQRSRHPVACQDKIHVIHEGIDTGVLRPDATAHLTLPNGHTVRAGDPVVTYVARNLEPYRGFHSFMRALEQVQKVHKHCQTIVVGGDGVSYGAAPKGSPNWREKMLQEVTLDAGRTHFLGKVPYDVYRKVLQVSAAHVYLTYPFVLSWSMLEAMATACLVIGSDTAPVKEVIQHGRNGLLVDFFDRKAIADAIVLALEHPTDMSPIRACAAHFADDRYGLVRGEAAYRALIQPQGGSHGLPT